MGYVDIQSIIEILETPKQEMSKAEVPIVEDYGELTNGQIERFVSLYSAQNMELVAEGYMNISYEIVTDLTDKFRGDAKAFKMEIIRQWAHDNPGTDQAQVRNAGLH